MDIKPGEMEILEEMEKTFDVIEDLFNSLSYETQDKLLQFHAENYSVNHCIRWGSDGITDVLNHINKKS